MVVVVYGDTSTSFLVCKCALVMLQVGEEEVFLSSEFTLVDLILHYYDLSDLALL